MLVFVSAIVELNAKQWPHIFVLHGHVAPVGARDFVRPIDDLVRQSGCAEWNEQRGVETQSNENEDEVTTEHRRRRRQRSTDADADKTRK